MEFWALMRLGDAITKGNTMMDLDSTERQLELAADREGIDLEALAKEAGRNFDYQLGGNMKIDPVAKLNEQQEAIDELRSLGRHVADEAYEYLELCKMAVETEQLRAEVERLRAIVEAIQPGTAEAFVAAIFDLAERCGKSPYSSESPIVFIEREIERLRALVMDSFREGFRSYAARVWTSAESWNASETKRRLS